MANNPSSFEVAIIGAGVAGLYASYCCGISGLNSGIIDALMSPGGQCGVLYPDKKVYGVPGFIDVTASEFISRLTEQSLPLSTKTFFGHRVENISRLPNGIFRINAKDLEIHSNYLIIASGIGDMRPSVPAHISGISKIGEDSDFIQYYCMRINLYADKMVIIAGGGDSAADFAINIAPIAKKVILIHRREKLSCEKAKLCALENLEKAGKLEFKLETKIDSVSEDERGRRVTTNNDVIPTDYIVFCYGFSSCTDGISGLSEMGLAIENNLISVDINTMETSIENCFAIGDVANYANKKKNIVPCFFEADRAVRTIKSKLS